MADPRDLIDLKTAVPSQALYDEIAVFEGFSPVVYGDKSDIGRQPMRGVPTIGYGTIDPHYAREGVHLTKEQAMALLKREVDKTIVQPLRTALRSPRLRGSSMCSARSPITSVWPGCLALQSCVSTIWGITQTR